MCACRLSGPFLTLFSAPNPTCQSVQTAPVRWWLLWHHSSGPGRRQAASSNCLSSLVTSFLLLWLLRFSITPLTDYLCSIPSVQKTSRVILLAGSWWPQTTFSVISYRNEHWYFTGKRLIRKTLARLKNQSQRRERNSPQNRSKQTFPPRHHHVRGCLLRFRHRSHWH